MIDRSIYRALALFLLIFGAPLLSCNLVVSPAASLEPTHEATAPPTPESIPSPTPPELATTAPTLPAQIPQAGDCSAAPKGTVPINIYMQPSLLSDVFGVLPIGQMVVIVGRSADGWLGFDPGVAQAGNTGLDRLRWLPPNSPLSLTGSCDNLQILSASSNSNQPLGAEPTLVIINFPGDVSADVCSVTPVNPPVNIRSGPGTTYSIIGKLSTPAPFAAIQGDWYTIKLPNGATGWVASTVSALIGACDGGIGGTR